MNKTLISIVIFICTALPLSAQEKVTVASEASEGKVTVYYELKADPSKEYKINLLLKRTSQPSFTYIPENLEGDIDEGKFASGRRKITWRLSSREKSMFSGGDDFYFEVTARPVEAGTAWYYYVGAALVAGGAAAAIVTWNSQGGDSGGGQTNQSLPTPPGRP
ncbi:MAG TPA: hypothetical protein VHO03_18855 [Ignavibacteriales bacterium]|nr:hypothetical protein [Ignavibacteriales bacterium]